MQFGEAFCGLMLHAIPVNYGDAFLQKHNASLRCAFEDESVISESRVKCVGHGCLQPDR